MSALTFNEVARLINHSRVTEIDSDHPQHEDATGWAIYTGVNKVLNFKYPFNILFLGSDCSQEAIRTAGKSLRDPINTQVVFAPSIKSKKHQIEDLLPKNVAGVANTKDFLFSFLRDQLSKYQAKLSVTSSDFVEPGFEVPSGLTLKRPSPLRLFVDQPFAEDQGGLAVLLGEPGQGKTYTAKYLAYELIARRTSIPIFVHSPQWASMLAGDLGSIWKTISHSFKYFETPIDWIEGCEEEFINVSLKAGLFAIIFDGLDEYILWNGGKVGATEARDSLLRLASSSGSRILTTCRTSFWRSNFEQTLNNESSLQPLVYILKPFDRNQAREYFRKRLPDSEAQLMSAMEIYSRFSPSRTNDTPSNFVGRGFILNLIADLVSRSEVIPTLGSDKTNVIRWIISALCEREEKRQNLPISPEVQIRIFEDCAEEIARGHKISDDNLAMLIQISGLPSSDEVGSLIGDSKKRGSLQDHPLIRHSDIGAWEFVHEQILFNLLAQRLTEYVELHVERLSNFLPYLRVEGSLITDLATAVVEQFYNREQGASTVAASIRQHVCEIVGCSASLTTNDDSVKNGTMLATTIALLALTRLMPVGQQHTDRTRMFLSFFPKAILKGVVFAGTISKMDFTGVEFEHCSFHQVTWANCEFDSKTRFSHCVFMGGKITFCKGFGQAEWVAGHVDSEANAMINSAKTTEGKRKYTSADLRYDIEQIIKKFVPKEGVGFKSVYEPHLYSGAIQGSIHCNTIIDSMKRHLLEENRISGVTGQAYHVKESAKSEVQHYASNGVFTGALADAFSELLRLLKLT